MAKRRTYYTVLVTAVDGAEYSVLAAWSTDKIVTAVSLQQDVEYRTGRPARVTTH